MLSIGRLAVGIAAHDFQYLLSVNPRVTATFLNTAGHRRPFSGKVWKALARGRASRARHVSSLPFGQAAIERHLDLNQSVANSKDACTVSSPKILNFALILHQTRPRPREADSGQLGQANDLAVNSRDAMPTAVSLPSKLCDTSNIYYTYVRQHWAREPCHSYVGCNRHGHWHGCLETPRTYLSRFFHHKAARQWPGLGLYRWSTESSTNNGTYCLQRTCRGTPSDLFSAYRRELARAPAVSIRDSRDRDNSGVEDGAVPAGANLLVCCKGRIYRSRNPPASKSIANSKIILTQD